MFEFYPKDKTTKLTLKYVQIHAMEEVCGVHAIFVKESEPENRCMKCLERALEGRWPVRASFSIRTSKMIISFPTGFRWFRLFDVVLV